MLRPCHTMRMNETYEKRMKINEMIFIRQKSFEMLAYVYHTSGVLLDLAYLACA